MTDSPKLLGPDDEPRNSGAVVAVRHGNYRYQEIWVRSGAQDCWLCLGTEFGRPKVWIDSRMPMEKLRASYPEPGPGPGEIPQYPDWSDVLARGPVTLLVPTGGEAYWQGWRNGRRDLWNAMENAVYDDPREAS